MKQRLSPEKTALISLIFNFTYSLYHFIAGFMHGSWWFITLGAYYIVLGITRFGVLLSARQTKDTDFILRFTGILLIVLSVTLFGVSCLSFFSEQGIPHHMIAMITIAAYSFTRITLAIINLVRAGRNASPINKALRSISFADALVAIFSLQRSMLVSFSGSSTDFRILNAFTGSAVYLIIIILGINLIGGKKINMAKNKIIETNEKIAEGVTSGYKKIEKGVVEGYQKIEKGVVGGYQKIEDKFIDQFLKQDGETLEEAKERLKKEN